MGYEALSLDDYQLVACSPWRAPDGAFFLELPLTLVFPKLLTANTNFPAERQPTPPKYPFVLRAIGVSQATVVTNCYGRFQWPSGRYWSNVPEDLQNFYSSGDLGRLVDPPVVMPPGSMIRMQLENRDLVNNRVLTLFFEGYLRIPMTEIKQVAKR